MDFINDFNNLCLKAAVKRRIYYRYKERELFQEKIRKDEDIVNQSFHKITGSYSKEENINLYNAGNNLFTACQRIADYLKVEVELSNKDGELTLEEIAESLQIRYRPVFLDGNWWKDDVGPLLAFINYEESDPSKYKDQKQSSKAVALIPISPSAYKIFDPVTLKEEKLTAEAAEKIKKTAFSFYPPLPDKSLGFRDLILFSLENFWSRDIFL